MLVKPLPWVINSEGKVIEYGGTYMNRKYQSRGIISQSYKNPLSKNIKLTQNVVNVVNTMSFTPFQINTKLFYIVTSKEYILKDGRKLLDFDIHPDTALLSTFLSEKNFVKSGEVLKHNSNYIYNTSILNIAYLMRDTQEFYNTAFLDWRGIIYFSTSILNIQGGELARSLLLLYNGHILNKEGLKVLKIYTANAYGLDKKSKVMRVEWVDKYLQDILDVPNNDIWLTAEEPLIFLACAL